MCISILNTAVPPSLPSIRCVRTGHSGYFLVSSTRVWPQVTTILFWCFCMALCPRARGRACWRTHFFPCFALRGYFALYFSLFLSALVFFCCFSRAPVSVMKFLFTVVISMFLYITLYKHYKPGPKNTPAVHVTPQHGWVWSEPRGFVAEWNHIFLSCFAVSVLG